MTKPVTTKDKTQKGYIYCHEMVPKQVTRISQRRPPTTYIKLGRSVRPVARLSEWTKQCPSREPIVRGFFPEKLNQDGTPAGRTMAGAQIFADSGLECHHRWERLCLLEVAGWALLQKAQRDRIDEASGEMTSKMNVKVGCEDCGRVHVELFELDQGSYETFVRELIVKWQRWCVMAY